MDKRKNEYVELARLIEAEFHARQDAGILANLNKKNVEGLHVTRDKILKDMLFFIRRTRTSWVKKYVLMTSRVMSILIC